MSVSYFLTGTNPEWFPLWLENISGVKTSVLIRIHGIVFLQGCTLRLHPTLQYSTRVATTREFQFIFIYLFIYLGRSSVARVNVLGIHYYCKTTVEKMNQVLYLNPPASQHVFHFLSPSWSTATWVTSKSSRFFEVLPNESNCCLRSLAITSS